MSVFNANLSIGCLVSSIVSIKIKKKNSRFLLELCIVACSKLGLFREEGGGDFNFANLNYFQDEACDNES